MRQEAGSLVRAAAQRYHDRPAFVFRDQILTFQEVNGRANRLGSGLLAHGLARRDRVGLLAFNRLEVIESWFGMEKHHLVRAALQSDSPLADHVARLREIEARALIFSADFSRDVEAIRGDLPEVSLYVSLGAPAGMPSFAVPYEDVLSAGSEEEPKLDVDESDPVHIQYTSGTTAVSKPWTETFRSWRAVIETNAFLLNTAIDRPVDLTDVNLHGQPLQFASGFQMLFPYFIRGCKSVLLDDRSFDPDEVLRTIDEHQVTGMLVPGPRLALLLASPALSRYRHDSLRRVVCSRAGVDVIDRARAAFGEVCLTGYGSTETGNVARLTPREYAAAVERGTPQRESVGRVSTPFVQIRVVDDSGCEVPPGQPGEIVARSPMSGGFYWGRPEQTAQAFFPGDWFRSGDAGWLDQDGYLYYGDRVKDCIRLGPGQLVYPHTIEDVLRRHRAVANAGVVGVRDSRRQEQIVACVLPKARGAGDAGLVEELLTFCRVSLREHEVPAQVLLVEELPTVSGGMKVQRSELRARLAERLLTRVDL